MGRPKNYVPAELLSAAVRAFRRHGYGGASVDVLCEATGLRRGSLYAAYPDKRALFLAALRDYAETTVGHVERTLGAAADPVGGIAEVLRRVARVATDGEGRHGCLLTNTAAELAGNDAEVRDLVARAFSRLEAAYAAVLVRGKAAAQVPREADPEALARLLVAVMQGLRVLGKAGADLAALHQVVDAVLRALGAGQMPNTGGTS
jgi:TetR/AcrR family transcriptional repressor of nem operon